MFAFYWPWMALLFPLPFIAWYFLPPDKNANADTSPEILFPHIHLLATSFTGKTASVAESKKWFIISLISLWFFLVLSVMRPQLLNNLQHNNKDVYDIMLAVDISSSMRALDFSTKEKKFSRLDVTKNVAGKFVLGRKGDRLGLILFGEYAYLQVPMTFDNSAVNKMLQKSVEGMAGLSTAIGDAIGLAVQEIRGKPTQSRILVLLTDGSDTSSNIPPLEAAQIARQYGIRIYVIGVGTKGPVPYPDDEGKIHMIEVGMDEPMLQKIANITGGQYFKAADSGALQGVYNEINELEKVKVNNVEYKIRRPLYRYPLGIACILFLVICLIPIFRRFEYARRA